MTALLLAISMALGVAAFRWPLPGLLAYLWLDFMRPLDYLVALRGGFPMMMIGVGLVLAALHRHRPGTLAEASRAEALRDGLALGLLCLAVLPGIALSEGVSPALALVPLKLAALSWLLARLLTTPADIDRAIWVVAISLSVLALDVIVEGYRSGLFGQEVLTTFVEGPGGAGDGAFRDNNDLARALVFGLPLAAGLALSASARGGRLAGGLAMLALLEGVVITASRGGFVALICVVAYLLYSLRPPRRAVAAALGFSLLLVVVGMPDAVIDRIATIARPAAESSVQSRVEIWRQGLRGAIDKPWFGHGIASFAVPHAAGPEYPPRTAHNIFVELFYETGAVGLAAYLFVLVQAVWRLRRAPVAAGLVDWARVRRVSLEASVIGFLVASLMLSTAFQSIPFVIVGLMLALERAQQSHT